ncbi:hypothetical protein OA86_13580 [Kaistella jeonii]|uniref:Uncharacterized protein n=1 Tax=Kaistella jeonii TaxID=266749 RepID=A0A0C1FJ48_9FLAO|nr:hypothetical protein OA86_13580 [Kaistella jeonii]
MGNPLADAKPTARVGLSVAIFFAVSFETRPRKRISTSIPIANYAKLKDSAQKLMKNSVI